ncbi:MAG TPA: hypothetical protein VGR10_00975, partial [Thermoleophilaceae bacterium]|nr:hypothetical protein [Thermoleophilaceae bacterium]
MEASPGQPLRPLNFGEVLDVSLNVVVKNLKPLLAAVAVVVVPVQILSTVVLLSTVPDLFFDPAAAEDPESLALDAGQTAAAIGGFTVTIVFGLVGTVLATGACFKAISDAYLGEPPSWRESLHFALRRLRQLLWVTLLYGVLTTLAVVLLVVPAVYLWVAWAVAIPAVLVEDVRGRRALGRSFRLIRGRWWASFGILLIGFLIAAVVQVVVGLAFGLVTLLAPESLLVNVLGNGIGTALAAVLATPIQAAFIAILYFDLRVRKEGFDLLQLAERIGASPDRARSGSPYVGAPAAAPGSRAEP